MKYLSTSKVYKELADIKQLIENQNLELLDLNQAADYLKLKPSYLYSLTHQKKIPHYKPGGKKVYFDKLELNKWIKESKIKSVEEVESEYNKQKETEVKWSTPWQVTKLWCKNADRWYSTSGQEAL